MGVSENHIDPGKGWKIKPRFFSSVISRVFQQRIHRGIEALAAVCFFHASLVALVSTCQRSLPCSSCKGDPLTTAVATCYVFNPVTNYQPLVTW